MINKNYVPGKPRTQRVTEAYEELYSIAQTFYRDKNNHEEFKNYILAVHNYFKDSLPVLARIKGINEETRINTLLNMVCNNNNSMKNWAKDLGFELEKLSLPGK